MGEIEVHALSEANARKLTERIQESLEVSYELLEQAFQGGAWYVLGYESWDAYCASEFSQARMISPAREQRQEICARLADAGMSNREIASATGLSKDTVRRALPSTSTSDSSAPEDDVENEVVEAELVDDEPPPPAPKKAEPLSIQVAMNDVFRALAPVKYQMKNITLAKLRKTDDKTLGAWSRLLAEQSNELNKLAEMIRKAQEK